MATKPAPRRTSSLAGQHPVSAPAPSPTAATAEPPTTVVPRPVPPPVAVTQARATTTTKATYTADTDVLDAAKNAFWASRNAGYHRTFSDFVNDALRQLTAQLRADLNDGKPFPARPTDKLPPGRVAS